MPLTIGIDIGTTHIKACVLNEDMKVTGFAQTRQHTAGSTSSSVSPNRPPAPLPTASLPTENTIDCKWLWEQTAACVKIALKGQPLSEVTAIGITSMAEAGVPIDVHGTPLSPIIPWNAPLPANTPPPENTPPVRHPGETAALYGEDRLAPELRGKALYNKTGLIYHPKYSINRILWYKDQCPDIYRQIHCYLSVADYIAHCLTGECITEESLACRTMLYNIHERCWDPELTAYAGMEGRLPSVLKADEEQPILLPERANEFGLTGQVKVRVCGHDHLCAAAALQMETGELLNSMGTSEVYIGFTEKLLPADKIWPAGILQGRFNNRTYFICNMPSSGASVEWLRNFLSVKEKLTYEELLTGQPDKPSPVTWLPFVNGAGTHRIQESPPGALVGIDKDTNRAQILQAILEGIACESRAILERIDQTGIRTDRILSTGGGIRNTALMQAKADITGRSYLLALQPQATAIGAALIASNQCAPSRGACTTIIPNEPLRPQYDRKYQQYTNLIRALTT